MNLGQLADTVYVRTGVPTDDGVLTAAVVRDLIRTALRMLETALPAASWLETAVTVNVVEGTTTYALPADWSRTVGVTLLDGEESYLIENMGALELDTMTWSGRPEGWAIANNMLVIGPIPDAPRSLTHRYQRIEPTLALDADQPLLPVKYREALAEYATMLAWRRLKDEGRAAFAQQQVDRWVSIIVDEVRQSTRPPVVRTRSWH